MEQTPSAPGHSPELPSVSSPSNEQLGRDFSGSEQSGEDSKERQERRSEAMPAGSQAAPLTIPPIPIPAQTPSSDDATDDPQATVVPPTIANDEELIEKEWVNKAKEVIEQTKGDPHKREKEVSRLQVEYLSKRYGRNLGSQ